MLRTGGREIALGSDEARALAAQCGLDETKPAVIFGRDRKIDPPTPREVARALGQDLELSISDVVDVAIVGGGPAGLATGSQVLNNWLRDLCEAIGAF